MATTISIDDSTATEAIYSLPEVNNIYSEIIENRRWFHAHPELSFQEVITANKVYEILVSYGYTEIYKNIGKTGVVAVIRGAESGPCIALRADMDGLPILETAEIEYKSKHEGVMHACGHDGHMASLLAVAKLLINEKDQIKGTVKFVFQPAEEGYGGAKEMINDGCLEEGLCGPRVDEIYGIHIWSFDQLGKVACEVGPVMAASDRFCIEVKGKGGHGAAPHQTVDAIVAAASLVTNLQSVIARNKDPLQSGVLTCGTIKGGYGYNIIADKVEITGTCRSFTPETQELIKNRMHQICCGTALTFGGEVDMKYHYGYPPTVNSYPECHEEVIKASTKFVGRHRTGLPQKTMGAEDFSYFLQERPGCFFFVGAALPGDARPHHKSVFDFDERAMLISASIMIELIRNKLTTK